MVGGSESGFCRAQTIIIHNYSANYFNIITAPLPPKSGRGDLWTYFTGKFTKLFTAQLLVLCFGHESLFSEDEDAKSSSVLVGEGLPAVVKLLLKLLTRLQELQGKVSHLWYLLVLCFGKEKLQLLFPANLERASFASGYHFQILYFSFSLSKLYKWKKIDETVDKAGNWQRQMSNYEEGSCWEIKWKDGECRYKSFSPDNSRTPSQKGETHQEKETYHGKKTHQQKETHQQKKTHQEKGNTKKNRNTTSTKKRKNTKKRKHIRNQMFILSRYRNVFLWVFIIWWCLLW